MEANNIYVEQGSDEWHELRLGRATASKFGVIMAGEKYAQYKNYRADIVTERLTGNRNDFYKSKEMQWGTDHEPDAALEYWLRENQPTETCGFFAHKTLMAGASPDRLVGDDGLLEIKCPNTATHIETLRKQKVPNQYIWQVMGQLWLTGRKWCDFVSYDPRLPDNASYFCIRVERDEEKIRQLEMEVKSFLDSVDTEIAFITNYRGQNG